MMPTLTTGLIRTRRDQPKWALLWLTCAWVLGATSPLWAQDMTQADIAQRQRIAQERQQANSQYQHDSTNCRSEFLVSDCLRDAKSSLNLKLDDLRRQDTALNDQVRQRKAAQAVQRQEHQLELQESKSSSLVPNASAAAAASAAQQKLDAKQAESRQQQLDNAARAQSHAATFKHHDQVLAEHAASAASASARQQAYLDKLKAARQHQADLEARQKKAVSAANPLPAPTASAAR